MTRVYFTVPLMSGKARVRFSSGHAFTSRRTREDERTIADGYRRACGNNLKTAPANVPVHVSIWTTRNVLSAFRKRDGDAHDDISRPDADNVAKLVLDALNGIAYADDAQVTLLHVEKLPRRRGHRPSTTVKVEWRD